MHYRSKMQGQEHSEEILDQNKTKNQLDNSRLCISMSDVICSSDLQPLSALLTATHFLLAALASVNEAQLIKTQIEKLGFNRKI